MDKLDELIINVLNENNRLRKEAENLHLAIRSALDLAGHRWSEWGSRAESVEEVLESALENSSLTRSMAR